LASEQTKQPQVKKASWSAETDKKALLPEPAGKKLMAQRYKHLPEGLVGLLSRDNKVQGVVADPRGNFEPVEAPAAPGPKDNPPEKLSSGTGYNQAKNPGLPAPAEAGLPEKTPGPDQSTVITPGPGQAPQDSAQKSDPQPLLEHKAQAGEHPAIWHGTMPPDLLQTTPPRPTAETPVQGAPLGG
jgi:hypothetical protein